MRSKLLAPRRRALFGVRALCVCAIAATISGASSCGGASSGSTIAVAGTKLTIYASVPAGAPSGADILAAEQLAFRQGPNQVGKYQLVFKPLSAAKVSDNARTAIQDLSAIAYLGEIAPGTSRDSVGITNGGDLLQVSPTDTAVELTQGTSAVPGAPNAYYEALSTYGRTFARVVPNTAKEAKAQVQEMHNLGVSKLYVADDASQYGAAIALAVRTEAAAASLAAVRGPATAASFKASGADAFFYGASPAAASSAATLLATVAESTGAKLFVPSALDTTTFASKLGAASLHLYVSSPGYLPSDLTPAGQQFVTQFQSASGHQPSLEAIFGYEAMKAVLAVLQQAGTSANDRSKVVRAFLSINNRSSVLGTYSINANGDTSLAPFVFSRLRAGALVPFAFLTPQG